MMQQAPLPGPALLQLEADERASACTIPLFYAASLFALGIVLAHCVWLRPSWLLVAVLALSVLCVLAALRAPRVVWPALAAIWIIAGAWCAEMEPQPAPDATIASFSDGLLRTVEGTVTNAAPLKSESDASTRDAATQAVDVRLASIEAISDTADTQLPVDGGVRLSVRWPVADSIHPLACGETIRADVRLLPPEEFRDPGAWSRRDYLLAQQITASGSLPIDRVERLETERASLSCWLQSAQIASSAKLLALPAATGRLPRLLQLSNDDAVMLSAVTTGDRTFLSHRLRAGFERTGSFHMLVVSGLHLAIVAGFCLWLLRRMRVPQVPATLITIGISVSYALVTGFAAPVVRSLCMVVLYLVGRLVYRERSALNTIGFAALCLLTASPRSLLDASFQMTLLAVIAIAGIAAPTLERTLQPYHRATRNLDAVAIDGRLEPKLAQFRVVLRMIAERLELAFSPRIAWRISPQLLRGLLRLVELVVIAAAVELAMTMPMAIYFHRVTLYALPVNLFVVPLLAMLVPCALITVACLWVWPAVAVAPAAITALLLHGGEAMVAMFGSLSLGDLRVPTPSLAQCCVFVLLLAAAVLLARSEGWIQRLSWVVLALASAAALLPRAVDRPQNAMLFEALDVGQGDSLLLISPDGKTMLIDGGGMIGADHAANFDIGEQVVSASLWARGIRRLDVVALTHAHADHLQGLPAVLRNFRPRELWIGRNPPIPAYNALLDEANQLNVKVRSLHAGDAAALGSVQLAVLAPIAHYQPGAQPSNNDSLVMRASYGATSVLLEGDAEAPIEDAMLREARLNSSILKVGHHGSLTSTRPEFLATVHPQWAVISCGLNNRFGHPREGVLSELESAKVQTFSTDIQGAVCFTLDGKTVTAQTFCGVH